MKPLKDYSKDELTDLVGFYRDREKYFSQLLGVTDMGQFRADWDSAILQLVRDRDKFKERLAYVDDTEGTHKKLVISEALRSLLIRAKPFTEGNPLYKEIGKFLGNEPELEPLRDALEAAMAHLMVWHHRYPEDVDTADKVDLNWILLILDRPKRYQDVPNKDLGGS